MIENKHAIDKIKLYYNSIFPAGKKISDYILNNPEEVINLSIKEFARKLKINEANIVKFSKFLGYKGYKDFKIEFIKDFAIRSSIADSTILNNNYSGNIAKDIFFRHINNLKDTLNNLDYSEFSKAVKTIIKAKRIIFFASGASIAVAFDSFTRFLLAGFETIMFFDQDSQKLISKNLNKDDVAIGISLSGETQSVLDSLKNAKMGGSQVICITSAINSNIMKISDIKLITIPIKSKYQRLDMNSRTAQIAILDSIFVSVCKNKI